MESARFLLTNQRPARGFTLIEMVVVLGIIAVVTTITLTSQQTFDRSLLLTDTAYRVALSIRQMQTYGLSSRVASGLTNVGYGFHAANQTRTGFTLFADTVNGGSVGSNCLVGVSGSPDFKIGDCVYQNTDQLVETYAFSRGFKIADICGKDSSGVRHCMSDAGNSGLSAFDTVFLRPDPDAVMTGTLNSAGNPTIVLNTGEVYITTADAAAARAICISTIGQISVVTGACP
jgi:prepilin-type N-terminal cleavage/methylation domain-containing protein